MAFFIGFIESLGLQPTLSSAFWPLNSSVVPSIHMETALGDFPGWNLQLMPSWWLLERNHRLWALMRKAVRVNFLVFLLSLFLSLCATLISGFESRFRSAYGGHLCEMEAPRSTILPYVFLRLPFYGVSWLRALLSLAGQWPLYMTLQCVGVMWYNPLYSEVWMIRKGLLRPHNSPWGAAVVDLQHLRDGGKVGASPISNGGGPSFDSFSIVKGSLGLVIAICRLLPHTVRLTALLLIRSTPPTSPTEWLLGDQKRFASVIPGPSSLTDHLEIISVTVFKLVATSVFAFCALVFEKVLGGWSILFCYGISFGTIIGFVMNSFLYSFYVFDYRYALQLSPTRSSRLTLVEQLEHYGECWAYNIGYGSSMTLLSYALTSILGPVGSVCIVSVIFAWQVACSGYARPIPSPCTLHIFLPWFEMLDFIKQNLGLFWRLAGVACLSVLPLWYIFFNN
ncbi:unnamed protein product [Phytomonas sp. Hart1]|nr:unnamed protein product [Phytomonas sp. Hart1]|eukprot:CCW67386.1 unnamed protein product [Phytomonas sp. isolate Hart1]